MKVYSIGREVGCDIVINDRTDVISRRHAILNVMPFGKMTIVDQSQNGTYVNGIRIASNVPVPVTRKDNISFAHVARLDWNMIPNTQAVIMRWIVAGLVAVLLIVGGIIGYNQFNKPTPVVEQDSLMSRAAVKQKLREEKEKAQQQVLDSLRRDSIRRDSIRRDSIRKAEAERKCPTCKKKITDCQYKGKHPEAKCKTCGKVISKCQYKGNHPASKPKQDNGGTVGGRPQQK